ncbi:MAG: SusC/RagA family TonB-linked outer membrane protein [Prevotellaceae bacterium]|nr:SusC/RagA family TonB-linked outer membrane protein [Prevotella sp.]MDD7258320.1 SusC/RagA family TonB-linked outer membrane protein [Prevotellaceae bacterium]MDY6129819.1 SusC/RagA family TonB-linked outer membrane protein [Prevotella sp.]
MKKRLILTFVSLFLCLGMALAQSEISGTIISQDDGQPVMGASVCVVDQNIRAVSDMNGHFVLKVKPGVMLEISYLGMITKRVKAANEMRIILVSDATSIDEVVVTAMGITRKQKSIGYSSQEIKSDKLQTTRVNDLGNALAGKISGARFIGGSSATFNTGTIVLRGTTSLSPNGSEPIYVVDGVITNKNMINMDDVAAVNVLKGPAATALYGSQGDNGAVIITTKSVGEGSQQIDISHTTMFNTVYNHFNMQTEYGGGTGLAIYKWKEGDPEEWKALDGGRYYDYGYDESWGSKFDGLPYIPFYAWDPTSKGYLQQIPWSSPGKHNMDDLYRTGLVNTTNVAFSRAGKDYMSRISFSNTQNRGVVPNSDAIRRFLAVKTQFSPMQNLEVNLDFKYTFRKDHNPAIEAYSEDDGGMFSGITQWFNTNVDVNSLRDYRRPDGSIRTWNIISRYNFNPAYHNNTFAMFNEMNRYSTYQWNVFRATATYKITNNLKAGFAVNGNIRNYIYEGKIGMGLIGLTPSYSQSQNRTNDITTQGSLTYNNKFLNDKLTFDASAFVESRYSTYKNLDGYTQDGLAQDGFFNLGASAGKPMAANYTEQFRTQSLFGNLTLGYDDTYYLDLSGRNDRDSRLPKDKNSYFYGGASVTVLMSNLLPKNDILTFWKLRASAAQVGSTLAAYRVFDVYNNLKFGTTTYLYNQSVLRNTQVKPTISTSYEVGTEFRLFKNRIWGDFNFYTRDTKDQIIDMNIAPASGFSAKTVNAGLIRNQGFELMLGGRIIDSKDWTWELTGNIAKNTNKLLELTDGVEQYRLSWYGFSTRLYQYAEVGKPLGVLRGCDWDRDENGNLILYKVDDPEDAAKYGQYLPDFNPSKQEELGNIQPDATGGVSTSLRWKGLTLSASVDFQIGGSIGSVTNMFGEFSGMTESTTGLNDRGGEIRGDLSENGGVHLKGVTPAGEAVDTYVNANYYFESLKGNVWSQYVFDTSYVKLRELSLSYEFPKSLLAKTGFIKQASLSFVAQNPWLIYSAMPNVDVSETAGAAYGFLETGQAMSTRSFGFTVKLTL